jgi:N-acetylmuramoyl-L-alanine amidase
LGQRLLKISASVNGQDDEISYLFRKGNVFASATEIAKILSGRYYYNEEASKVELKFRDYNLKFTGRNQFVILKSRNDNTQRVLQLPVSTMIIKGDVYIPLTYCTDYLSFAFGGNIVYDDKAKHLTVSGIVVPPALEFVEDKPAETRENRPTQRSPEKTHRRIDSRYDIYGIDIEEKVNGTLIRIKSQKKIVKQPRSALKDNILYVYLSGISIDPDSIKNIIPAGLVKRIRYKSAAGNPQLEFVLNEGYSSHETFYDIGTNDILVSIHTDKFLSPQKDYTKDKEKWLFDVVVIDPGHGGKDPGAIGITGIREKDINLGIALKLGKLIEKNHPDVKVVYTRKTDTFVELYKRGKIANENNGKLFISIHANSMGKKHTNIRGFDVYLLRPGKTQDAIEIAEIENSVIQYEENPDRYEELTDENFILVSMAHSSFMRYSEKFSELLLQEWSKDVGIPARGIKQAGFYVLVGASMPSVLIETGFITNKADEAYLNSQNGQQKIAQSLFNAIKKYRNYYEETFIEEER